MRRRNVRYSAFSELENDHEVWAGLRCSVQAGGAAEGGHAESDWAGGAGAPVDLGEFVFGAGEADLESFGFAEPAFAVGFGDAGGEVVTDLGDAGPLGGVGPVQGASQAALTEMILVTYPDRCELRGVRVLTDGDWQESWFAAVVGVSPGMASLVQSWAVR
jgi:hypothetical protein